LTVGIDEIKLSSAVSASDLAILEHIMCIGLSTTSVSLLASVAGTSSVDAASFAHDLGTKCRTGHKAKADHVKAPWVRRMMAESTPPSELSPFVAHVLTE